MFAHLPPYKSVTLDKLLLESEAASKVHPAVLRLGLKYAGGAVVGANARCLAMLRAFSEVIEDYATPEGKVLSRDLAAQLNTAIQFLVECRPLSVSMGNAIKFLKLQVSKVDPSTPEAEAKQTLLDKVERFIEEKIVFASREVVANAATKVENGDVILTYAHSAVIFDLLLHAHKAGVRFKTIVVDGRPHCEGRKLLRKLLHHGIPATYCLLNSLSYVIQEVTKTFLGASAVMSNGGPSRIASSPLSAWSDLPYLGLLNVMYDAMPSDLVTLIVTELGIIPPTSVPVILREYRQDPPL
ncbi:hypothetical protein WJX73_001396 [Symbiochloris irregularis]|uniref:Translation initiation factor eIF2B subunit delta n=1 Tax=Symbiochloris irregularis TaxID=706552 RepID=A0AAW1NN30_9CHLO